MALTQTRDARNDEDESETVLTDGGDRQESTYPVKELLEDAAGL